MEKFEFHPTPDEEGFWVGIGKSFGNLSQALWELCDNSISIMVTILKGLSFIDISFERTINGYRIRLEDTGPGIKNIEKALTVGNKSQQTTPLNEHGYGMKNALAFCDLENRNWCIYTKTEEDNGTYKKISAPYSTDKMGGVIIPEKDIPWPGHYSQQTGTIIEIDITPETFFTLREKWSPNAQELKCLEYFCEDLSFVFSGLILKNNINIQVRSESILRNGEPFIQKISALNPAVKGIYKKKQTISKDFGGGKLEVEIEQIEMDKHPETKRYYQPSPRSSGVEVRINGRVIAYNLYDEIWSRVTHPSSNRFLMIVNLISNDQRALPSTNRTKTGLLEKDPKTSELFNWIRTQCPNPPKQSVDQISEKARFKELCRDLESVLGERIGDYNSEVEFKVFKKYNANIAADMYEYDGTKTRVYEGKNDKADLKSLFQLLMYWEGAVADGIQPNEGILLADDFSVGVEEIIQVLNKNTDANGYQYNFKTQTWDQTFPKNNK